MNDLVNYVVQNAEQGFSTLIQFGIDLGIPFDCVLKSKGDIAYFQGCIQWVIFVITLCISSFNSFIRACIGSVR